MNKPRFSEIILWKIKDRNAISSSRFSRPEFSIYGKNFEDPQNTIHAHEDTEIAWNADNFFLYSFTSMY